MIIIKPKGEPGPLHCDKVSFTLGVQETEKQQVMDSIDKLGESGYLKKTKTKFYSTSVLASTDAFPPENLLIQADPDPTKPNMVFLRFEFNPARFPASEVRVYVDEIVPNGGYKRLIAHGTCTRIDITVDVHQVEPSSLLIRYADTGATCSFGKSGRVGTMKLGSQSSKKQVKVYDKRAELKKSKKKWSFGEIPDHPVTRIELELRERFPAKKMASLPNPFAKLKIAHFRLVGQKDELFSMFLLAGQFAGIPAALARLGSKNKKLFLKRISAGEAQWWDPKKLWSQWKGVAEGLMHPPKGSFNLHPPEGLLM